MGPDGSSHARSRSSLPRAERPVTRDRAAGRALLLLSEQLRLPNSQRTLRTLRRRLPALAEPYAAFAHLRPHPL